MICALVRALFVVVLAGVVSTPAHAHRRRITALRAATLPRALRLPCRSTARPATD